LIDELLDELGGDEAPVAVPVEAAGRLLWHYAIAMAPARSATPGSAAAVASELGYPVAVKAVGRRPGRSTRAGVALDLNSGADVDEALATMREALGDGADFVVVQQMVSPGIDVRVQCVRDDQLGPVVSVGLGGEQAELIGARASRLAPLTPALARSMLRETRAGAAIAAAGFDESPLVDVVVEAAQLIADHRAVSLVDLNPVIVSHDGAIVTDAAVTVERPTTFERPLRRLD
jgi:hypothetical protein